MIILSLSMEDHLLSSLIVSYFFLFVKIFLEKAFRKSKKTREKCARFLIEFDSRLTMHVFLSFFKIPIDFLK
jgi:hypothetical protein